MKKMIRSFFTTALVLAALLITGSAWAAEDVSTSVVPLEPGSIVTWSNTGSANEVTSGYVKSRFKFRIPGSEALPDESKVKIKKVRLASISANGTVNADKDPFWLRINGVMSGAVNGIANASVNDKKNPVLSNERKIAANNSTEAYALEYEWTSDCIVTVGTEYGTAEESGANVSAGLSLLHNNGNTLASSQKSVANVQFVHSADANSIFWDPVGCANSTGGASPTPAVAGYYPVYEITAEVIYNPACVTKEMVSTQFVTKNAPENALKSIITDDLTAFGKNADYAQTVNGRAAQVVSVQGALANNYTIFGGAPKTGGAISTDIWMEVMGGTYNAIFGGSNSDDWSSGSACSIDGNIVLEVGGDTVANNVLGGNYKDGKSPKIKGDIDVVVKDNAVVKGLIAGAGISAHNGTSTYEGNVSVLVKNVQSDNTAGALVTADSSDYIVGGGVYGANTATEEKVTGNTLVTIDLPNNATGNFVKNIVGGGFIPGNSNQMKSSVGGASSVIINAPAEVTFTGNLYAGGYSTGNGTVTVTGNSTLTLNGGTYSGSIKGGASSGIKTLNIADSIVIKANGQTIGDFDAVTIADGKTIAINAETEASITIDLSISVPFAKTGAGTLDLGTQRPTIDIQSGKVKIVALASEIKDGAIVFMVPQGANTFTTDNIEIVDSSGNELKISTITRTSDSVVTITLQKLEPITGPTSISSLGLTSESSGTLEIRGAATIEDMYVVTFDAEIPAAVAVSVNGYVKFVTGGDITTIPLSSFGVAEGTVISLAANNGDMVIKDGATILFDANGATVSSPLEISGALSGTGAVAIMNGAVKFKNNSNSYTGGLTVKPGAIALTSVQNGFGATGRDPGITVEDGGAVDIANTKDNLGYHYIIAGTGVNNSGVLYSTQAMGIGARQTSQITLSNDATIVCGNEWGLIASGYDPSILKLDGHTLMKKGSADFILINTGMGGSTSGAINISEGSVRTYTNASHSDSLGNYDLTMESGTTLKLESNMTVKSINGQGDGVKITNNKTLTATTYTGKIIIDSGSPTLSGSSQCGRASFLVRSGATMKIGLSDFFSYNKNGYGTIDVYGTLDFGAYRQTLREAWTFNFYSGCTVNGYGDNNANWPCAMQIWNADHTINFLKSNTGNANVVNFNATLGLQNNATLNVADGVTVVCGGATSGQSSRPFVNKAGSGKKITKTGEGQLKISTQYTTPTSLCAGTLAILSDSTASVSSGNPNMNLVVSPEADADGFIVYSLEQRDSTTVYLKSDNQFYLENGTAVTLIDGDEIVVNTSYGNLWNLTMPNTVAGHKVTFDSGITGSNGINLKSDVLENQILVLNNEATYLYKHIDADAQISGAGMLYLGYAPGGTSIAGGVVINCPVSLAAGNVAYGANINGAVTINGEITTPETQTFKLATANASLKVPQKLADGKVECTVEGMQLKFDETSNTYSLYTPKAKIVCGEVTTYFETPAQAIAAIGSLTGTSAEITFYEAANIDSVAVPEGKSVTIVSSNPIFNNTFTKTGEGALTLDAPLNNGYTEFEVVVSEGTLGFSGDTSLGEDYIMGLSIAVAKDAVFEFAYDQNVTMVFSSFSGDGTIRKTGFGILMASKISTTDFDGIFEVAEGTFAGCDDLSIGSCLKISGDGEIAMDPDADATLQIGESALVDFSELNLNRELVILNGRVSVYGTTAYKFADAAATKVYRFCEGTVICDGVEVEVGTQKIIQDVTIFTGEVENFARLSYDRKSTDPNYIQLSYDSETPIIRISGTMTASTLNQKIAEADISGDYAMVYFEDGATLETEEDVEISKSLMMVCLGNINLTGTGTVNAFSIGFADTNKKTLNIGEGATFVPSADVHSMNMLANATITGAGTIVYDGALPGDENTNYQNAEDWTGTVWLKNKTELQYFDLSLYGNANSTIAFTGISGFMKQKLGTVNAEIKLVNSDAATAFKITNGWSGDPITFNKLSGSGKLEMASTCPLKLLIKNWDDFSGSISVDASDKQGGIAFGNTIIGGNDSKYSYAITVEEGAIVNIVNGATWSITGSHSKGIAINGTVNAPVSTTNPFVGNVTGTGTVIYDGAGTATAMPTVGNTTFNNTNWRGTVRLSGITTPKGDFNPAKYGSANSIVEFNGISPACFPESGTFGGTIKLTDKTDGTKAWTMGNGYSRDTTGYVIAKLTGDGEYVDTNSDVTQQITVKDGSEFFGSLTIVGKRFVFGTTAELTANMSIVVQAGKSVSVAAGKTWTATNGIKVSGKIGGAGKIASALIFNDGATLDASAESKLTAESTVAINGILKVKVAEAPTGNASVTLLNAANSGLSGDLDVGVVVETSTGVASGFYKLVAENDAIVLKVSDRAWEKTETVNNNANLGDCVVAGGRLTFDGFGGIRATSLQIGEGSWIVLDPVKTPLYVTGGTPTLAAGTIALASSYAETTLGKVVLMTWQGGSLNLDAAALKTLVKSDSLKSGIAYTVEEVDYGSVMTGCRQLVLKIGDYDNQATPLKVMPLGDSITEGSGNATWSADGSSANYRIGLMERLAAIGYKPISLGFRTLKNVNAAGVTAPAEYSWHNGISGQRVISIAGNNSRAGFRESIETLLEAAGDDVDVVTFKIGTNDAIAGTPTDEQIGAVVDGWTNVMWRIIRHRPTTKIVVGSILYMDANRKTYVEKYNAALKARLEAIVESDWGNNRVTFVDLYAAVPEDDQKEHGSNFYDNLHPNWLGHGKMADAWLGAIKATLATAKPTAEGIDGVVEKNTKTGAANNVKSEYREGFEQLYVLNAATCGKFARAGKVPYTTEPAADDTRKFAKVAYYMELRHRNSGHVRYVWADMDNFNPSKAVSAIPVNTEANSFVVSNLHVDTNDTGIEPVAVSDSSVKGFIQFTAGSAGTNATQIDGAPGNFQGYDWNDTMDTGSGYAGVFHIARTFVASGTAVDSAQMLMSYNSFNSQNNNATEIGIGNFAQHFGSGFSMNNIFTYNTSSITIGGYSIASIEIWGKVETTWTGENSHDWNDAGNWSNGVPTEASNVVIPENAEITLNNDVNVLALKIQDASASITGTGSIKVTNLAASTFMGTATIAFDGYLPDDTIKGQLQANTWTGTAWIKNVTEAPSTGWNFNNYGNDKSTVRLTNIAGCLDDNTLTTAVTIDLVDGDNVAAFTQVDNSVSTYVFNKLTGTGTFKANSSSAGNNCCIAIVDVSEFNGAIVSVTKPIVIGANSGTQGSESKITFADGVSVKAGLGWEAESVAFGATIKILNAALNKVLVTGLNAEPASIPGVLNEVGNTIGLALKYEAGVEDAPNVIKLVEAGAKTGGKSYETIEQAINANEGAIITIEKDTTLNLERMTPDKTFTLDTTAIEAKRIWWNDIKPTTGVPNSGRYLACDKDGVLTVETGAPVNDLPSFESYVLGLKADDETSKPTGDAPADNGKDTLTVEIKGPKGEALNVRTGYKVEYIAVPTAGAGENVVSSTPSIDLPLPESGEVKYSIKVKISESQN